MTLLILTVICQAFLDAQSRMRDYLEIIDETELKNFSFSQLKLMKHKTFLFFPFFLSHSFCFWRLIDLCCLAKVVATVTLLRCPDKELWMKLDQDKKGFECL